MTTFNGERYLAEQLDSLAAQQLLPFELHVGDDCSTDRTADIVADFAGRARFPVHFTSNPEPLGYGENFVRTALRCGGDWIAFCDQDDVWLPEKLRWCAGQIAKGPDSLCLIAHNAQRTDEQLRPTDRLYDYRRFELHPPLRLPPEWHCIGMTQVFRASLLRDIPSERRVSFPWHPHRDAHDVWVALLANVTGTILRTGRCLARYRRHQATATGTEAKAGLSGAVRSVTEGRGADYALRAAYLQEVSAVLIDCASGAAPPLRDPLLAGAAKIRLQARLLEQRARVYTEASFGRRAAALADLAVKGGYFGGRGWPFGAARMAKDVLHLFS